MNQMISCPACQTAITVNQLFWTGTLLRFKCPHCATRVQPTDKAFARRWLVISGIAGLLFGVAASMILGVVHDATERRLAYIGLFILAAVAIVVIKWRASLALVKKGELKVAA